MELPLKFHSTVSPIFSKIGYNEHMFYVNKNAFQ